MGRYELPAFWALVIFLWTLTIMLILSLGGIPYN